MSPRATSRWAVSTTSSATRSASGPPTRSGSAAPAASTCRRCSATTRRRRSATPRPCRCRRSSTPPTRATPRPPASQTLYFGDRGAGTFAGYGLVDLASTWSVPVWRTLSPWVKFEALNAAEQPEADRLGHVGHRQPERRLRRQRAAARLHQGRELRQGDEHDLLPAPPPGHGRRPDLPRRVRAQVLSYATRSRQKVEGRRQELRLARGHAVALMAHRMSLFSAVKTPETASCQWHSSWICRRHVRSRRITRTGVSFCLPDHYFHQEADAQRSGPKTYRRTTRSA